MKIFKASKTQLKALLSMEIGSVLMLIVGIIQLVYCINHDASGISKFAAIMFIVAGLMFQVSAIASYLNTTFEVILNEDYICINKPGLSDAKSLIINYSDIKSVVYREKEMSVSRRIITTITLNTAIGVKLINNIENAKECSKLIEYRINNGTFENYDKEKNKGKNKDSDESVFYYNEEGYLRVKKDENNSY